MPGVFLLCEYPTLNGGEQSMLSTLEGIRAAGFTPTAIAPAEGPLGDALRQEDVEVLPWRLHDDAGKRLPQNWLRQELAGLLRRRRPDLLHANSLSMGRLSGPVAAELKLPSLAHLRDIIRLSDQAAADLNCHRRLLAVSEATRQSLVATGLSDERTHVLFNGVDLRRFRPRTKSGYLHRELGLRNDAQLIGTVGQICLRKGQDVLAQAAASLADSLPRVHYLLVGERHSQKEETRELEAKIACIADRDLAGRFHLLGFRTDVEQILGELTLLVHPSRQEPLGRVLLEAAAGGVPVIATEVGGTSEIFPPHSCSARLVAADDPEAMATAIVELIDDPEQRGRLAAAARRRAEEAFDIRHAVAGLLDHYRELVDA